jgi:hypothetical protein
VISHSSPVLRIRWFFRALGRNPLIRPSDRIEAYALLMVFVVAFAAIPFASAAGDAVYDDRMRVIDEQLRTRTPVDAIAVGRTATIPADATGTTTVNPGRFPRTGTVQAQWREGDQLRTESIPGLSGVEKGDHVTVWLDSSRNVVPAPDTPEKAQAVADGRTWTVWMGAMTFAILTLAVLRFLLDRLRARSWERELQLMEHNDDGWANRHG